MSESNSPGQGPPTTSNLGGKRIPGQRSVAGQNQRDGNIRAIKELWGVSEFVNIFPVNIRPKGDLGDSAISNLRSIAKKMPNLAAARALMLGECVDASGRSSSLSFKNTANILNHLKAMEQMVKDEEKDQKAKVLNSEENKKLEEAAQKEKTYGKPPMPPLSEESFRPAHKPAINPGPTLGYTLVASKESTANKSAAGKMVEKSKATPAKKTVPDKVKASTPASRIGIVLDTPSVAKVRQRKEPAIGLHAPNLQDVAPFNKTPTTAKGAASKKAPAKETITRDATSDEANAKEANSKKATSQKATSQKAIFEEATPKKAAHKEAPIKKPVPMKATFKEATSRQNTRDETLTRKGATKKYLSLGKYDESIESPTSRGFGVEREDSYEAEPRQRLMTDDNGIPIKPAKGRSRIPSKRPNEDNEALSYGGLTFSKESIMAELNFKKRVVEKDGHATPLPSPSEAETEIDIESVPNLLRDNVAIKFGFDEAAEAMAAKNKTFGDKTADPKNAGAKVATTKLAGTKAVEAKSALDKAAEPKDNAVEEEVTQVKLFNSKAMTDAKTTKEKVAKDKTAEKKTEKSKTSQNKRSEKNSDGRKDPIGATDKGSKKRKLVASDEDSDIQVDVNVDLHAGKAVEKRKILKPIGIHPKLDAPFTTHFDKPSKDIASLWSDREEALASIPQTPTSPIDHESPIRDSNLIDPARSSSEISDFRISRNTASLSPVGKVHTDPKLSKDHSTKSTNLTSKNGRKSTVPEKNFTMERSVDDFRERQAEQSAMSGPVDSKKDILEYTFSELVELARAKAAKSTKAGQQGAMRLKDPMDYTIRELRECLEERRPAKLSGGEVPATGLAGQLPTPAKALPMLPETLVARVNADRVLITSVPGIIKAYVEELRAIVADGKGPDGDLLSMIIVNKYGYFLEHVEKLDKDLKSLYYEALERNP